MCILYVVVENIEGVMLVSILWIWRWFLGGMGIGG